MRAQAQAQAQAQAHAHMPQKIGRIAGYSSGMHMSGGGPVDLGSDTDTSDGEMGGQGGLGLNNPGAYGMSMNRGGGGGGGGAGGGGALMHQNASAPQPYPGMNHPYLMTGPPPPPPPPSHAHHPHYANYAMMHSGYAPQPPHTLSSAAMQYGMQAAGLQMADGNYMMESRGGGPGGPMGYTRALGKPAGPPGGLMIDVGDMESLQDMGLAGGPHMGMPGVPMNMSFQ